MVIHFKNGIDANCGTLRFEEDGIVDADDDTLYFPVDIDYLEDSEPELTNPLSMRAVDKLWRELCRILPKKPIDGCVFWADMNNQIMSESEAEIDRLADAFDALYGEGVTVTGYYDSEEDHSMGETDMHTGYYYCSNS